MPVAYSFTFPGSVDGKIAGILGTFTSAVGIYQMWPWFNHICLFYLFSILVIQKNTTIINQDTEIK